LQQKTITLSNKKIIFFLVLFAFSNSAFSQYNQWAWIQGDITGAAAVHGTQGVANAANFPGARYAAGCWVDQQERLWMFGGTLLGYMDDLWMYNPATNLWTWMKGANTFWQPPVYGVQGIPSAANTPGGRGWEPATWADNAGNLWLYGGSGNVGNFNDLWKYTIATGNWTWMQGSSTPNQQSSHGTKNVAAASNTPGFRYEATCTWVDGNNKLWLFGGESKDDAGSFGVMNDLWMYDPATNLWTWVSGDRFANQPDVYGTMGVAAAANKPGGRAVYTNWMDGSGNLWIFGGYNATGANKHNDIWKYDMSTGFWTWMNGNNIPNQSAVYGTLCQPSVNNRLQSRLETSMEYTDDCNNFWQFGGFGSGGALFNDLWRYNTKNNTWVWVKGDNIPGQSDVFGTQGVFAAANKPGARHGGLSWVTKTGFWLYGGAVTNANGKNVLWRYVGDKPVAGFTKSAASGCAPVNINFTNTSTPGCNEIKSYLWNFGGGINDTSTLPDPSHTYNTNGTFTVSLVVINCTGSKDSTSQTVTIGIGSITFSVSATQAGCTNNGTATINSVSGTGPYTYSWSNSQTTSTATGLAAGNYTATVTDASGCSQTQTVSVTSINPLSVTATSTQASCTASNGTATLNASNGTPGYTYSWSNGETTSAITGLSAGTYTATVTDANGCTQTQTVTISSSSNNFSVTISFTQASCIVSNGTATANASGGTNPFTYSWNNGQTTTTATGLGSGNYTITITDGSGCIGTQTVAVTSANNSLSLTTTSTQAGCTVSNGTAIANASSGTPGYTYSWNNGQSTQTATGLGIGNYTATVTDANGCTQTQTVAVTSANNNLSVTASSTQTGCTVDNGTGTANASGGTPGYTYSWNNGQTTQTATGLAAGNYSVTITDASGCTQMQAVSITQTPGPTIVVSASPSIITLGGSSALTSTGGGTYSWSPVTDLSCTTCANPTATPSQTTSYCVRVTDNNGCQDSTCIVVTVGIPCGTIYIPNAFSPNNDLENDLECVIGNCIEIFHIAIFNRWGEQVFSAIGGPASGGESACWDGTYKGKQLNSAVFNYYLEATLTSGEKINKKGNISLIR